MKKNASIFLLMALIIGGLFDKCFAQQRANSIKRINIAQGEANAKIIVECESPAIFFTHSLNEGRIFVLDLAGVQVDGPVRTQQVGNNGVAFIRQSQFKSDPLVARVVIGFDGPGDCEITNNANILNISRRDLGGARISGSYAGSDMAGSPFADYRVNPQGISNQGQIPGQVVQKPRNIGQNPALFPDHRGDFQLAPPLSQTSLGQVPLLGNIPKSAFNQVSFSFRDIDLYDLLAIMGDEIGINLLPDKKLNNQKIDFTVDRVTGLQSLELLLMTKELDFYQYADNALIITEKGQATNHDKRRIKKNFQLIDAEPSEIIKLIRENKHLSAVIDINNISTDERLRSLLIYDRPQVVDLFEKVIKGMDKKRRQCSIELRLVEIYTDALTNLGLELEDLPVSIDDIGRVPSHIKVGATINALAEQKKAKVLSSPRIRVVDGKEGLIKVGESLPVPYYSYAESGKYLKEQRDITIYQPLKQYRNDQVGIEFKVTPTIYDDRQISLYLDVDVTDILEITSDQQLHTSSRQTKTEIRVKHGETVILGGLIKHQQQNRDRSVPIIERLPIIGDIMSRKQRMTRDSEMMMFITTHLVNEDGTIPADTNEVDPLIELGQKDDQEALNRDIDKAVIELERILKKGA